MGPALAAMAPTGQSASKGFCEGLIVPAAGTFIKIEIQPSAAAICGTASNGFDSSILHMDQTICFERRSSSSDGLMASQLPSTSAVCWPRVGG